MTMTIKVKTESGAEYIFSQENGKIFFVRDYVTSGEVVKFHQEIELGKTMKMDFIQKDFPGDEEEMYIESTKVVEIKIS